MTAPDGVLDLVQRWADTAPERSAAGVSAMRLVSHCL